MVASLINALELPISRLRLESYRPIEGSDLDMVVRYFWDIELARALMPSIHGVELSLRNSIHEAMTHLHGGNDLWFYQPGVLEPGQLSQLANALRQLSQRKAQPTSGRIVAEVMFGFWVALLTNPYEARLWQPNGFALLRTVFPHAEKQSIKSIAQRYNEIQRLRNRVSHHEAIWDRPNLRAEHERIRQAIAWISPDLERSIALFDTFPEVHANGTGFQVVEETLRTQIATRE